MARQVLPIVGAVIGAYFGGPQGAQIGFAIGSMVGNAVDPLVVKAPSIGDSRVQTSAEVIRPIYFGTACGAGNIIMSGPDIKRTIENDPGKGGQPIQEEERIYKTFAIGIGDGWTGAIVGVSRIWENEKLVYDTRPGSTMVAESAKFRQQFTLYLGTEDQLPDPDLESIPSAFGGGVGNVSAFRGLAYIVFKNKDITPWMSVPQYRFEVVTEGSSTPPVFVTTLWDNSYLDSPDGEDWSGNWQPQALIGGAGYGMFASQTSHIAHRLTSGHPLYRDGNTGSWAASTGALVSGTGGTKRGCADNGVIIIPNVSSGVIRSVDDGRTYEDVPGTTGVNIILTWFGFHYGFRFINSGIYRSSDNYTTASLIESVGTQGTHGGCGASGLGIMVFAGSSPPVESVWYPQWSESPTGSTWADVSFTEFPNEAFVEAAAGVIGQDETATVVLVTDGGHIVVRHPDGSAEFSDYVFPVTPTGMCFNGERFFITGGTIVTGSIGTIASSPNGVDGWEVNKTWSLSGVSAGGISALAISAGTVTSGPVRLDDVVKRIHELCGQSSSKVDAAALSSKSLGGFIIAIDCTGAAAIQTLASIYQFCSPEYDKQIHHRFHGGAIVRTITDDDLVDEPDEGLREDQIEFPKKLHLEAQNTATGYAPAKETSERESSDVRVVSEMSVSVSVVFAGTPEEQAQEHAQRANILHKAAWESARGEREIVIPDKYLTDVPGDCYLVNIRGRSDRMMITKQNYVDGVIRLTLRYDRASAYQSNRAGNTPSEQTPPPSTIVGPTGLLVLDIPALRDEDDINSAVRYVALGPITSSWYGGEFGESLDGGSSYYRRLRIKNGAVMGTLQDDVAAASEHYTDRTNKVRLQLDLASYAERVQAWTEQQFLSERGGFALVNEAGDVEVLQYMEVDDLGNGLLELSVLLRGRFNSGTYGFPAGSRFVLLETTRPLSTQSSYIGQKIWHRAVSFDSTGETATIQSMDFEGNSQREWPVANVLLARVGDVINVTIVPRHRFGTDLAPVRSTNWSGFNIEFRDATDQVVSFDTISPTYSYDASTMTFPIEVTVSQLNRITGPGPTVTEVIE